MQTWEYVIHSYAWPSPGRLPRKGPSSDGVKENDRNNTMKRKMFQVSRRSGIPVKKHNFDNPYLFSHLLFENLVKRFCLPHSTAFEMFYSGITKTRLLRIKKRRRWSLKAFLWCQHLLKMVCFEAKLELLWMMMMMKVIEYTNSIMIWLMIAFTRCTI